MSAETAADLRAAADVLRRDGWTQGALTDMNGCHCAAGAILAASDDYLGVVAAFRKYLDRVDGRRLNVVNWNDEPGRTAGEVIAALEAAAEAEADVEEGDE